MATQVVGDEIDYVDGGGWVSDDSDYYGKNAFSGCSSVSSKLLRFNPSFFCQPTECQSAVFQIRTLPRTEQYDGTSELPKYPILIYDRR